MFGFFNKSKENGKNESRQQQSQNQEPQQSQAPNISEDEIKRRRLAKIESQQMEIERINQIEKEKISNTKSNQMELEQKNSSQMQIEQPVKKLQPQIPVQASRVVVEQPKFQTESEESWLSSFYEYVLNVSLDGQHGRFILVEGIQALQNQKTGKLLLTEFNIDQEVLYYLLSSKLGQAGYFNSTQDKILYLLQSLERILEYQSDYTQENSDKFIRAQQTVRKSIATGLVQMIITPVIYDILDQAEEDYILDRNDLSNSLLTNFYEKIRNVYQDSLRMLFDAFAQCQDQKDDVRLLIYGLLKRVMRDLATSNFKNTQPYIANIPLLNALFSSKLAHHFTESGYFLDNSIKTGREFQERTILGKILSVSIFPQDLPNLGETFNLNDRRSCLNQIAALRSQLFDGVVKKVQELLHILIKEHKDDVIRWMMLVIGFNSSRKKTVPNQNEINSDGFFFNFLYIVLTFAKPIAEKSKQMISKIRLEQIEVYEYFRQIEKLANNRTDKPQLEKNKTLSTQTSFTTEIFFLAMASVNQGQYFLQYYQKLQRILEDQQLHQGENSQQYQTMLQKVIALDIYYRNSEFWAMILQYFHLQSEVLENLLIFEQGRQIMVKPGEQNFERLPITIIDDMVQYLMIARQMNPSALENQIGNLQQVVNILIILMGRKDLCENPHTRSQIMMVIAQMSPQSWSNEKDNNAIAQIFFNNPICDRYLMSSLIRVFIDAERTGSSNQFYEKFNLRYHFCQLFSYILKNHNSAQHIQNLLDLVKGQRELFLEFSNLYLNDIIYLLDESLKKLSEIKHVEDVLHQLSGQEKEEKEKTMRDAKRMMKSLSTFLLAYYQNISDLSQISKDAFLMEEIREKLVNNMNYTVYQLNSREAVEKYKVRCKEEVKFDPRAIMKQLVKLYINFSQYEVFKKQVVQDQRSFDIEIFKNTIASLTKNHIIDYQMAEDFYKIINELQQLKSEFQDDEDIFQDVDVPDEYTCPISCTIMSEPVMLPTSGKIVEKIIIKQHLLNDQTDPFNRKPLTVDKLIDQPELRKKIEQFKAQVRNEKKK